MIASIHNYRVQRTKSKIFIQATNFVDVESLSREIEIKTILISRPSKYLYFLIEHFYTFFVILAFNELEQEHLGSCRGGQSSGCSYD